MAEVKVWATGDGVRVNPETGKYWEDRVDILPDYPLLTLDKAISQLRKNYSIARQVQFYDYRGWYPKKEE